MRHALALSLALPLITGAGSPSIPDVVEAGRTAATLSDWQTITYFLIFLLVVSTVERLLSGWQARSSAGKLIEAMDRLGVATNARSTDITVTLALLQNAVGRLEKMP